MENNIEKKINRWVLGTVDENNIRGYLYRKPRSNEYMLVSDIQYALKAENKKTAEMILDIYKEDTGHNPPWQFVPIPIEITYSVTKK